MTDIELGSEQAAAIHERLYETLRKYGVDPAAVRDSSIVLHSGVDGIVQTILTAEVSIKLSQEEASAIISGDPFSAR